MDKKAIQASTDVLKNFLIATERHRRGDIDTAEFVKECDCLYDIAKSLVDWHYKYDWKQYWIELGKLCDKK